MPGLARHHDARPARRDDRTEGVQDERGADEVDRHDLLRRRLDLRHPGRVDHVGHVAQRGRPRRQRGDGLGVRHVHARDFGDEPGVGQRLGGGARPGRVQIGDQDGATRADPAGDRLADGSGPDENDDVCHDDPLKTDGLLDVR